MKIVNFRELSMRTAGVYLFITAIIFMALGLIMIGVYNSLDMNGFKWLSNNSIGDILSRDGMHVLKAGIVFAVILTPIFGIIGLMLIIISHLMTGRNSSSTVVRR